jgi:NitT/TauT family transport system substrate-binding protein
MTMTRRMFGTVAAAAAATALTLSGCGAPTTGANGEKLEDVSFGYINDYNGASLLAIAKDQGYWEDHGLNVKTSVFTNGPLQIQAMGAGDLDFGYIGPGAMWLPASGAAKLAAINTLGNADRVIAQPGISSMEDLRGKKIGIPEGTSGDMILTLALKKAGMTKSDVQAIPMDPATIVSAFSSRQIDGAGIWYPLLGNIKKQVPALTELAKNSDFSEEIAFPTAFVVGNDVVKKREASVVKVLAALRDAMKFRTENPEKTIELTAALLAVDPEQVKADAANVNILSVEEIDKLTRDGSVNEWFTGLNDYFIGAGKLKAPVDPNTYYLGKLFMDAGK